MRSQREKGGGLFQNIKALFTRKKTKPKPKTAATRKAENKNTPYQVLKGKMKGLNKPPTNAPTQYPITKYPFHPKNKRREAVLDPMNLQITKNANKKRLVTKNINTTTMSPPKPNSKPANIKQFTLELEPTRDGMRRAFLFFYNKMREKEGLSKSPNTLYASEDEMNELFYKYKLFKYTKFPELLKDDFSKQEKNAYTEGIFDTIAIDFFGAKARPGIGMDGKPMVYDPLFAFKLDIQEMENVDHVFPSLQDPSVQQFAQAYGGELGRYDSVMTYGARMADYLADLDLGFCRASPATENRPILKSFDSPFCICCFGDQDHLERYLQGGLNWCVHYFISNFKVLPSPDSFAVSRNPVVLSAKRFLQTSFVIDAFREQGVDTMDEDLFTLVKKEAPDLLESAKVLLVTPAYFKYLKIYDHFMVFSKKALPEEFVKTYRDPLKLAVVRRAFDQDREFLLCDPYTAYCTKKKNSTFWSKAFGMKTSTTRGKYWNSNFDIYFLLRDVEKLYVDFCQYQLVLGKYLDLTQNWATQSVEQNLKKASELYKVPIHNSRFVNLMYTIANGEGIFSEFKKIQNTLITHDTPIETTEQVMNLIKRINPFWKPEAKNMFEPSTQPVLRRTAKVVPMPPARVVTFPVLPNSQPSTQRSNVGTLSNTNNNSINYPPAPINVGTSAFSEAQNKGKQIEKALKRIEEINAFLPVAKAKYNTLVKRRGTEENLRKTYKLLLTKSKRNRLSGNQKQFMKNYEVLRNFPVQRNISLKNRKQQMNTLKRLGHTPLPSEGTMA